jgi:hypothetical protein
VFQQDLEEVVFDGPVLLQLQNKDGEVLGVVHLYGRTAEAILEAVYAFYLCGKPYEDKDNLGDDTWPIGLSCHRMKRQSLIIVEPHYQACPVPVQASNAG